MRLRATLCVAVAAAALGGGTLACVPTLDTSAAPCPCASGSKCCGSLAICIPEGDACPSEYPASSKAPCASDADCPRGEACHAWRLSADGGGADTLAGPQTCHRTCTPSFRCAGGERCQIALVDGKPLAQANSGSLCLRDFVGDARAPDAASDGPRDAGPDGDRDDGGDGGGDAGRPDRGPPDRGPDTLPECAKIGCGRCPADKIGRTYCADNQTMAVCYSALHPTCGLVCERLTWSCDFCSDNNGVVQCFKGSAPTRVGACASSQCAVCPRGSAFYCVRNQLRACFSSTINMPLESCSKLCVERLVAVCPNGCGTGPNGPDCRR